MSANISNVVKIQINRQTKAVAQAGFGIPLIMGPNGVFLTKTRKYEDLSEVAEDFLLTDDEYRAAEAAFSQEKKPQHILIGKQAPKVAKVDTLTFDVDFVASNSIAYKINGVAQTPVPFSVDHSTTLAALAAAIQAHALIATATVTGAREITITAQTAGIPFTISDVVVTGGASQPVATVANVTPNHGIVDDIIEARQENDNWYGLVITSRVQSEVELVAAYIETQKKLFGTVTDDDNVLDPNSNSDIGAVIEAKNYNRSFACWNGLPANFMDAAAFGRCLPEKPGAITWKFKTLIGITADNLDPSERQAALDKKVNLLTEIGGRDIFEEGTVGSGEFIDIIRDTDWLESEIQTAVFSRLVNLGKVPYTDAGVAIIEAEIRAVLARAVNAGVLAADPSPQVFVPKVADVPFNDRANRFLPDVTFTGTYASAIHRVDIEGTVSI
ncbi:MAG TPA: hypothetical protein DF383_10520 [Deltaproteobacteria bacterium]|nr:hypothetical protein [Deltaproteobacteria bacterium]